MHVICGASPFPSDELARKELERDFIWVSLIRKNRLSKMHQILSKLGVPTHLRGYWFLTWMLDDINFKISHLGYVTKVIYPKVGKHFNVSAAAVERDLRYMIKWTWMNGDPDELTYFLGYSTSKAPSNAQFMHILINQIVYASSDLDICELVAS